MRSGRVWLVVAILIFLHLFLHVALGIGRAAPDLFLVALLLAGRELGVLGGAALGFALGLAEDALSVLAFGAGTIALTVAGFLGGVTRDLFVGDSRVFVVAYLVVGKWLRDLVYWIVAPDIVTDGFVEALFIRGVPVAAYAAAVGVLAFWLAGHYGSSER